LFLQYKKNKQKLHDAMASYSKLSSTLRQVKNDFELDEDEEDEGEYQNDTFYEDPKNLLFKKLEDERERQLIKRNQNPFDFEIVEKFNEEEYSNKFENSVGAQRAQFNLEDEKEHDYEYQEVPEEIH
jgi:hypothetical protein